MTTNKILTPAQEFFIEEFLKTNFDTAPAKLFKFMRLCVEHRQTKHFDMSQWLQVGEDSFNSSRGYYRQLDHLKKDAESIGIDTTKIPESELPACGTAACIAGEVELTLNGLRGHPSTLAPCQELVGSLGMDGTFYENYVKLLVRNNYVSVYCLLREKETSIAVMVNTLLDMHPESLTIIATIPYTRLTLAVLLVHVNLPGGGGNGLVHKMADIITELTSDSRPYGKRKLSDVTPDDVTKVFKHLEDSLEGMTWVELNNEYGVYIHQMKEYGCSTMNPNLVELFGMQH